MTDETKREKGISKRVLLWRAGAAVLAVACTSVRPFRTISVDIREMAGGPRVVGAGSPSADELAGLGQDFLFKQKRPWHC